MASPIAALVDLIVSDLFAVIGGFVVLYWSYVDVRKLLARGA